MTALERLRMARKEADKLRKLYQIRVQMLKDAIDNEH